MATFLKRGKSWFVQVRKKGITKCSTWPTKAQAQAWATQTEAEILSGDGEKALHNERTLLDAIERYEKEVTPKKRGARWEIIRFNVWKKSPISNLHLQDITTPVLAKWRDTRLTEVSSATVNREMNLWSALLECARREWQWIETNPIHDVRRPPQPRHRERLFSRDEVNQICLGLGFDGTEVVTKSQIIACAFLFSLETAMRREEITGLEWERVNFNKRIVSLPLTKNGDARNVPLSTRAIELLKSLSHHPRPFDVDKDVLSSLFRRVCIDCKVENAHFHDARATALTRLAGILNMLELARMVGHRDIRSLQIYYREKAEDLAIKLG
jgi:integrase